MLPVALFSLNERTEDPVRRGRPMSDVIAILRVYLDYQILFFIFFYWPKVGHTF